MFVKDQDKIFDFVLPPQISYTYQGVPFKLTGGVDDDAVISGARGTWRQSGQSGEGQISIGHFIPLRGQTIFTTPGGFDMKYAPLPMPRRRLDCRLALKSLADLSLISLQK